MPLNAVSASARPLPCTVFRAEIRICGTRNGAVAPRGGTSTANRQPQPETAKWDAWPSRPVDLPAPPTTLQNVNLDPNWNWRGELDVEEIRPKPFAVVHPLLCVGTPGEAYCALLATL